MKVMGKPTKTEWLMLALAGAFLIVLALLYRQEARAAPGTDYTISVQRPAPAPVESEALPVPLGPVDINTADLEELQRLNGVGPVLAQRIIDYREEHGPFRSVDELLEVSGIGEATLGKFRDNATVGETDGGRGPGGENEEAAA